MPAGYAVGLGTTVGGALLLGIGAFVNRACVFGAIARLGSGEWSYVATPLGFYLGCVSLPLFYSMPTPEKLAHGSPVLQASSVVAFAFLALVTVRIVRAVLTGHGGATLPLRRLRAAAAAHFWSPHAATIVIGITFVAMFLLVGAWAYTDVLAELARGMSSNLAGRILLLVALFGGAALGGWTAERFDISVSRSGSCCVVLPAEQ